MLRAVYIRTLKPGVSDEEFVAAWMPEHHSMESYPARVRVGRSVAAPDQVISTFDVDVTPHDFAAELADLVHPDSERRLDEMVRSTEFEGLFEITTEFGRST